MTEADFTALSLYTGPSNAKNIIKDDNCPWIIGQWDGINTDTSKEEVRKDIEHRITVIINAFKNALLQYKTRDRHFVIPEFFFHCRQGPYPNIKIDDIGNPFGYIVWRLTKELKNCIPDDNNNYTIIIGSVLTSNVVHYPSFLNSPEVLDRQKHLNEIFHKHDIYKAFKKHNYRIWNRSLKFEKSSNIAVNVLNEFMQKVRGNPLCTVRNRGAYFYFDKKLKDGFEVFVYEKQSESSVDLTMGVFNHGKITPNGMITEWLANYLSNSIFGGDKQTTLFSTNARFSPSVYGKRDVGVEICLDHVLQRLRRTVDMTKCISGADVDNFPLVKQFIPSGGMQIHDFGVAAERNSVIFNADGCSKIHNFIDDKDYPILNGESGQFKGITHGVYNRSIQSKWPGKNNITYYSHSQLAFTTEHSKIKGFENVKGTNNDKASTYNGSVESPYNKMTDSYSPSYPTKKIKIEKGLFALNKGELHHFAPK